MSGWGILLIVLGALILLGMIKCGIAASYDGSDLRVAVRICGIHFSLFEEKPAKKTKQSSKKTPVPETAEPPKSTKKPMDVVKPFLPWWREILAFCGRVLTSPTIDVLQLEAEVGGTDAAACARRYGQICAGLNMVLPVMENTFRVKKQSIRVEPQFLKTSSEIRGRLSLSLRIYEIILLACAALKLLLCIRSGTKNKKKAVQSL